MTRFLYQPVYPWMVNQHFGANTACYHPMTRRVIRCDGNNPPKGYRSAYSMMKGHNGIDAFALLWQRCYAAATGVVIERETEPERGLGIGILHEHEGRYYKTRYWHLAALDVGMGDTVSVGQLIGYCGNTGNSSGTHLHFEVKEVDQLGTNLHQNNGYKGAENPTPLMFKKPAFKSGVRRMAIEMTSAIFDSVSDYLRGLRTG